jgi:hypothetical protein
MPWYSSSLNELSVTEENILPLEVKDIFLNKQTNKKKKKT